MQITAKKASAVAILIIALILVTPFCGLLFACGCTWPWSGFFISCNYFDPAAEHRCPWCISALSGWMSVGLSIAFGMIGSLLAFTTPAHQNPNASEYFARIGAGTLAFLCAATLSGWLAAHHSHYPFGLTADERTDLIIRHGTNAGMSQSVPPAR